LRLQTANAASSLDDPDQPVLSAGKGSILNRCQVIADAGTALLMLTLYPRTSSAKIIAPHDWNAAFQ
jgi:hypothetical protein